VFANRRVTVMRNERPQERGAGPKGSSLTLGQLRQLAAEFKQAGMSYAEIAIAMNTTAIRARDLCNQYERLSALPESHLLELSYRAIVALLSGQGAKRVAPDADMKDRMALLVEIAASYERRELIKEQYVGPRTCEEIEAWLISKGRSFRRRVTPPANPVGPPANADRIPVREQNLSMFISVRDSRGPQVNQALFRAGTRRQRSDRTSAR